MRLAAMALACVLVPADAVMAALCVAVIMSVGELIYFTVGFKRLPKQGASFG